MVSSLQQDGSPLVPLYGDLAVLQATANYVLNPVTGLWVPVNGDGTNGSYVQGSVASGVADAGNPVKVGGVVTTTFSGFSVGTRQNILLNTQGLVATAVYGGSGGQFATGSPGDATAYGGGNSAGIVVATQEMYNGTNFDRMRNNVDTAALVTLTTAGAGTTNSTDQTNYNGRGLQIGVNITAVSGGQTLTIHVQGKDVASGTYYDILVSAALAAVAFTQLTVYPGGITTANVATPQPLPRTWRVQAVVAGAGTTVTATVGASVIL
jgi:hypothetical protein